MILKLLQLVVILVSLGFLIIARFADWEAYVGVFEIVFLSILFEALPFILLGSFVSGIIEVFVSREALERIIPKNRVAATALGAVSGIAFPVCECAIVPVVRRLLKKGVPLHFAIAYLLAAPIINPITIFSTIIAYKGMAAQAVGYRLGLGVGIAILIGLFMGSLFPRETALKKHTHEENGHAHDGCPACETEDVQAAHAHDEHEHNGCPVCAEAAAHAPGGGLGRKLSGVVHHAIVDFFDVGRYLVMGAFFAAILQATVNRGDLAAFASGRPELAILTMMAMAIVMNLCAEADAFVASSFRSTFLLSGQLGFMVLGPMFDIKLLLMYGSVFKTRAIIILATSVCIAVFLATWATHLINAALGIKGV